MFLGLGLGLGCWAQMQKGSVSALGLGGPDGFQLAFKWPRTVSHEVDELGSKFRPEWQRPISCLSWPNLRKLLGPKFESKCLGSVDLQYNLGIILCGKDVEHHNIVKDLMLTTEITYRPLHLLEGMSKDANMVANVTLGFVKDAQFHIFADGCQSTD